MITWGQVGLQDASSPLIEELIFFYDFAMMVLVFIITFVSFAILGALINKNLSTLITEGQLLECIWTLVPAIILFQIAIPSLMLLYILDERSGRNLTLKTMGHQWYWSYEYSDLWSNNSRLEFDSYINKFSNIRLLDTDNSVILPVFAQVRVLVSSSDVLHSWAIPRIGVKIDACPGRLNQVKFTALRVGKFYGQCSEICGANHSFIPISIEVLRARDFLLWVERFWG
jgi:cytochrome c oxidase subunit 2